MLATIVPVVFIGSCFIVVANVACTGYVVHHAHQSRNDLEDEVDRLHRIADRSFMRLHRDAAAARLVTLMIIDRTVGTVPCDVCGKPLQANEEMAVRADVAHQPLLGHAMCLPPRDQERQTNLS